MYISIKVFTARYTTSATRVSRLVKTKPYDFNGILTNYGWVIIPKTHFAYRWTTQSLSEAIKKTFPDISTNPRDIETIQKVVDEWSESVDLSDKPKTVKLKKADIRKQKDDALYRLQLREDTFNESSAATESIPKKTKKRARSDAITFIHAWNYFFSITHPKYSHLGKKESRKEISNEWNAMTIDEKENYREAYANLLKEGKDIHKGKIVSREEKLKKLPKKKKKDI